MANANVTHAKVPTDSDPIMGFITAVSILPHMLEDEQLNEQQLSVLKIGMKHAETIIREADTAMTYSQGEIEVHMTVLDQSSNLKRAASEFLENAQDVLSRQGIPLNPARKEQV